MKLKKYKILLFQLGILLFISTLFFFILEQQKKYISIDFSKRYAQNKTIELSGFEEGEQWRGNFSYDSKRVMEGKSSITLSSWYGVKNSMTWDKIVKIPSGYEKGYISLFVPDKKNLTLIKNLSLTLIGEKDDKREYELTSLLREGWNRIPVVIPQWGKITQLSFLLTSKEGAIAEINLDRMWIENTSFYSSDIFHTVSPSLSLRTIGERTYLYSVSPSTEPYTLVAPSAFKKGTIVISLIPEHAQEAALSLNGTTMTIGGPTLNTCMLSSIEGKPHTKKLTISSGADNLYVFLKGELKGKTIVYSLSNNGVNYETCGQVEWRGGGPIKLSLKGSYLIDSYSAEY